MNQVLSPVEHGYAFKIASAWRGTLPLTELIDYGNVLGSAGLHELVAVLYETWLAHNATPFNHFVHFNLGATYNTLARFDDARKAYLRAIELSPGFAQPHFNLGMIYERMGQPQAALAEWMWVAHTVSPNDLEHRSFRLQAMNNLGRLFEIEKKYADAHDWLCRSLDVEPDQNDVLHHLVFLRAKMCTWPVYAPLPRVSVDAMRRATSALAMISQSDDPEAQLRAARHYVETKTNCDVPALTERRGYGHAKLRIGYLSSDLCLHPVAMLTAELFELHDREHFEVYAYCWTREDGSSLRKRVIDAVDHFERIGELSDEAAAQRIRADEIDILIDLQGQTFGARTGILAARPAPIQITYLGLPATTGFPFIDYVIADRFLIPEDSAKYYSETPLYLPDVYQVSDRQRVIGDVPTRERAGLPPTGFVFCSLNNNFKFTPEMFDVWMRILSRVPGSVLWLLADNPYAEANLRREAQQRGVDGARLIFAPRVAPQDYLARLSAADLFLDTFPFNAGTTANDALWAGLPVLTRTGRTFASRMAGALLTAGGLPELITADVRDYEDKAVALALDPGALAHLRARLADVKRDGVLFDTPRFVRNLEKEFTRLVDELG
ncbi:tetratricopeptide repeat protein [Pararobbsia silviterrae]|uniref:protein O-GlcNAc transferase n=1 Tax=Pararobbsia silviterrae TaxID=1792498 RepID=A0A494Y6W0_9BURK|nr:tetratricopeptide repeat protein [Pararobbsia silviterrae]RKP58452.1 tetratricopeptide repeat protein [Pararobbsia silviterrae]